MSAPSRVVTAASRAKGPANFQPLIPMDAPLSTVMSAGAVYVRDDMDLEEVRALLLQRGLDGAPVVDAIGRLIGMITKTDLLRELTAAHPIERESVPGLARGFHVEELEGATAE